MKVLGISRGLKYSPNLVSSDAAIFTAVTNELRTMGHDVKTVPETEMLHIEYTPFEKVFTMARDVATLVLLEKDTDIQTQRKFINSIDGILTCTNKASMANHMLEAGIPQPEFLVGEGKNIMFFSTESKDDIATPLWLKNCDGCAVTAEDTVFCPTPQDFNSAFANMEMRGVNIWMAQEHQSGDLIKFYSVEGTDFFHWNYASHGHSKFGLEAINGKEKGYFFDAQRIKLYADMIAKRLNVPIYGGDAIIDENGDFYFIDFNDFPSFSCCQAEAAKAIAQRIVQQ